MESDDDLPNEAPAHKVYLDAYYIGKTEVTNAEFYLFWLESGGANSEHTPISYKGEFIKENSVLGPKSLRQNRTILLSVFHGILLLLMRRGVGMPISFGFYLRTAPMLP